jgi:hypothetical protein
MQLKATGTIKLPDAAGTLFDHGAFEPRSRRVFVAHTARDRVEVIDHDASRHLATLRGFPEAAGVVADDGQVLVTNRRTARLAWVDAYSLEKRAEFETGLGPNGVAFVSRLKLAVVACIGDENAVLQTLDLEGHGRWEIDLPGRPRWCVTDVDGARVFLAIRDPSMVLVATLPELDRVQLWHLPSAGAHGIDIDHQGNWLYVACDGGALVEVDTTVGRVRREWPLAGVPDATFYNPTSSLVHVAISEPGLVHSVNTRTGTSNQFTTARGAKTTALVAPDTLYVFSPSHNGVLGLVET